MERLLDDPEARDGCAIGGRESAANRHAAMRLDSLLSDRLLAPLLYRLSSKGELSNVNLLVLHDTAARPMRDMLLACFAAVCHATRLTAKLPGAAIGVLAWAGPRSSGQLFVLNRNPA